MYFLNKKRINNYLTLALIITILFVVGISVYLVKDFSGGTCGTAHNSVLDSTETSFSGLVLTNNDHYLQNVDFSPKELPYYEYYKYCVRSSVTADTFLEIEVLDKDLLILGTGYFSNTTGTYQCMTFSSDEVVFYPKDNLIGLRCVNCDGITNNLTIYDSNTKVKTLSNEDLLLIDKLDVDVVGIMNCKHISFTLFKYMLLFLLLIAIMFLIDWITGKTKEIAFDGWS